MEKIACPICGNTGERVITLIEKIETTCRWFCANCETAFIPAPLPRQPEYSLEYNMYFHRPSDIKKAYIMATEIHNFAKPRFTICKILEAGIGNGLTALMLKLYGYDVRGCDISKETADYVSQTYGIDCFPHAFEKLLGKASYDIIYASHLIEHYPDPEIFMQTALRLLKNNGYLILDTPDLDTNQNHYPEWHHFKTRDPLEHACIFSSHALRRFAWDQGFDVIRIEHYKKYSNMQAILKKPDLNAGKNFII